jgi:hypothetical protein
MRTPKSGVRSASRQSCVVRSRNGQLLGALYGQYRSTCCGLGDSTNWSDQIDQVLVLPSSFLDYGCIGIGRVTGSVNSL